jgi:hypothetical protein
VRHLDGPCQGDQQLGRSDPGLGGARHAIRQTASIEELECHVGQIADFADFVDQEDIGVPELGYRLGLDGEADELVRPRMVAASDHFQGHQAVETHLSRPVDDPHAPFAQTLHDLVTRNVRAIGPWSDPFHRSWAIANSRIGTSSVGSDRFEFANHQLGASDSRSRSFPVFGRNLDLGQLADIERLVYFDPRRRGRDWAILSSGFAWILAQRRLPMIVASQIFQMLLARRADLDMTHELRKDSIDETVVQHLP